jgi:signal transduction histidine kinase
MPRNTSSNDVGKLASIGMRRFGPWLVAGGVLLLLLVAMIMILHEERTYRSTKSQQVDAQAAILASTVEAALVFDDRQAAQEYVSALRVDGEVHVAAVYDARGSLFAGFSRDEGKPAPNTDGAERHVASGDRLIVSVPVQHGNASIGSVYMEATIEPVSSRVERYGIIVLLVIMGCLILVGLGITQAALTRSNQQLEEQRADLARTNELLRTQIEQREKAETALRQSQKMESIGQLTGGIAHDFNNLLQVIAGNLEILQRRHLQGSDEARHLVATAARGTERAAALTQRLLAFSRLQPLNPKPLDVNKLVAGMSELLHRTLGESIAVETVLGSRLWRVESDANQLESALLNLCVNGRDAMTDGGKLTIETSNVFLDEAYAKEQDIRPGQYVSIAVSDTGCGMTRDVLEKVFEPFFTTKDVGKGSGLGLSQVYGFMKQSGGHVKIYSEVGNGTTVKLYLPRLYGGDSADAGEESAERLPGGSSDRLILVVEDDADVRLHAVMMLRDLGYGVLEAESGATAMRVFESRPDVSLLFTDVGLPGGMNGRQLADALRERRSDLKVLFTTGYARNAIVHQGRLDPGVELITKPFSFSALANKIHTMLEEPTP